MSGRKESRDANTLYRAALRFGKDWLRPVDELADKVLPSLSEERKAALVAAVIECRDEINAHIWDEYADDGWDRRKNRVATRWVRERYPWMTAGNISRAVSQGVYYAWHG